MHRLSRELFCDPPLICRLHHRILKAVSPMFTLSSRRNSLQDNRRVSRSCRLSSSSSVLPSESSSLVYDCRRSSWPWPQVKDLSIDPQLPTPSLMLAKPLSKGEPCFFRLLVAMGCRCDGLLSLHVYAHTPRRTSVQTMHVLPDLIRAFLTQQYRSHKTPQSLMTR